METPGKPAGTLDPEFLDLVKKDRENFSRLSSETKVWLYRAHGASIGEGVELSAGALILSPHIELGAGVHVGKEVFIETRFLRIGASSYVGDQSSVTARKVVLHENVFLSKRIEIGGGGAKDPESEIEIGAHCHVGQDVHLNCCRKITVGEESTLSMGAMIMTHCFANSVLEGYPVVFAPVVIGKNVQLGLRCVIFPGITVEDGAVVGSNSNVMARVARETYVCGVPARLVGPAKKTLSAERRHGLAKGVVADFVAQLALSGHEAELDSCDGFETGAVIVNGHARLRLLFTDTLDAAALAAAAAGFEETVVLCLDAGTQPTPGGPIAVIDLLKKRFDGRAGILSDSAREFLRKRGIRLEPRTWTYRGGLI